MNVPHSPLHRAVLSLGSNLGEKHENLSRVREHLGLHGLQIERASSLYETEPVDLRDQDWFLNQVIAVATDLEPEPLLECCLEVEAEMGRIRRIPRGPRLIDVDLLLYDQVILKLPHLEIPHARMHLRRFVLKPLAEIAPDLIHPLFKKNVTRLLEECPDTSLVVKLDDSA